MSNFQPFSAGDHYAWQQAQQGAMDPPATPAVPPTAKQLKESEEREARLAELRAIDSDPEAPQIAGRLAAELIAAYPDRALAHVVDVEYRNGLSTVAGRAVAFKVWSVGTMQVSWKDSTSSARVVLDGEGRLFHISEQNANVEMRGSMRWSLHQVHPETSGWWGSTVLRLRSQHNGTGLPPIRDQAAGPATAPISVRRRRKAEAIRRRGASDAVAIMNLVEIYERTERQGPPRAGDLKGLRELARLRKRLKRRHARADRIDGKQHDPGLRRTWG